MKYVKSPSEIPQEKHWAAIVFGSIHVPGDERSRTNPGHGYPESWESKIDYIAFKDKAEADGWVTQQESRRFGTPDAYKIIEAEGKSVKTTVRVG